MSLVEDARRLAGLVDLPVECDFCDGEDDDGNCEHEPDCPMLALPRIVALVEAAERLTASGDGTYDNGSDVQKCIGCGDYYHEHGADATARKADHAPDCDWQALVAALRGEEATA